MKEIIEKFFIPIAKKKCFIDKVNNWMANKSMYPWDTSIFKIIDNLIIGIGLINKEKKKRKT
ncbi:MAG TPA: hypothetical protein P5270_04505 [Victivallales bacterium]|nr:hypothetical protein [Victivallales bacterium]HPO90183.1 hypothetical protein [Victivallales bacterium]HRR28602.1 hypothetical protein [Victivallales bacterium]HRU00064.1 hypothetical protein [Victivallales bacterium]